MRITYIYGHVEVAEVVFMRNCCDAWDAVANDTQHETMTLLAQSTYGSCARRSVSFMIRFGSAAMVKALLEG